MTLFKLLLLQHLLKQFSYLFYVKEMLGSSFLQVKEEMFILCKNQCVYTQRKHVESILEIVFLTENGEI